MIKRAVGAAVAGLMLVLMLSACSATPADTSQTITTYTDADGTVHTSVVNNNSATTTVTAVQPESVTKPTYAKEDEKTDWNGTASKAAAVGNTITLKESGTAVTGMGLSANNSTITVFKAGVYTVKGSLSDGQIIVDTKDTGNVVLVLSGVTLHCKKSAPLYVKNAAKTIITLADGTVNRFSDGSDYALDNDKNEPNATLFSKDDLTINGSGKLIVEANYNNGIACKDVLNLTGGTYAVTSVDDGIQAKDGIALKSSNVTIKAQGDGVKTTATDAEKGYIQMESGSLAVTSGCDGLQASGSLRVSGGAVAVVSGNGKASAHADDTVSKKALKAGTLVDIAGGTLNLDAADDALHSNNTVSVRGGTTIAASGDDGVHADTLLKITNGVFTLKGCRQGLESAAIEMSGGTVSVTSISDAVKVADNSEADSGENIQATASGPYFTFSGGRLTAVSDGDGVDVKGKATISGGTLITQSAAGADRALRYKSGFTVTGGTLITAGSGTTYAAPGSGSQPAAVLDFGKLCQPSGNVMLKAENGSEVASFTPQKAYQTVMVCSSALHTGSRYTVAVGGNDKKAFDVTAAVTAVKTL